MLKNYVAHMFWKAAWKLWLHCIIIRFNLPYFLYIIFTCLTKLMSSKLFSSYKIRLQNKAIAIYLLPFLNCCKNNVTLFEFQIPDNF